MRLELTGRQVSISPGLRALVDDKLQRVLRQVNDRGISATVTVSKEKFQKIVDVSLHARGERFLHAVARAETWELAVNAAAEKLEQQARKMKGKLKERQRRGTSAKARAAAQLVEPEAAVPAPPKRRVIRASRYSVKPMTVDEAALELEGRDDEFLVFRDAVTDAVNVLYRRKSGQFGLIEPDA
ncbi:MAG: ribosome-associated translation inhibitor RaiA [Vicinamibacterales bacterium]